MLSGERGLGSGAEAAADCDGLGSGARQTAAAVQGGMGSAAELCELGTPPRTAQSLAGGRWQSAGTESKKNEESNIFKLCIVECSGFRYEDFMAKKLKT